MVARAMANFGLVGAAPRRAAQRLAEEGRAFGGLRRHPRPRRREALRARPGEAIADLNFVLATTARRARADEARLRARRRPCARRGRGSATGQGVGILFGRERTGLENDEISLADAIVTFPVDPHFSSLNLAQAVLLVGL